jgi:hypothetical protein
MHWEKLIRASKLYRKHVKKANEAYDLHMKEREPKQWERNEGPSEPEIKLLFTFLNQLGTHYPNNPESRIRFKRVYKEVLSRLRLLEGYDLIEAPFDGEVADGETLSGTIQEVFEALATANRELTKRYESTGTAKILHVLRPRLFVMWDSAIRSGYAVKEGSESSEYGSWFLPRMQREAREAVDSFVADTKSERGVAVQELEKRAEENLGEKRFITKLLDEYNWCKFRLGCRELWE